MTPSTRPTGSTLLIGGARSGKSSLAVEIGRRHEGAVVVIATATALDDDMADRIARHREERPDWPTTEEPCELADALSAAPTDALVLVDCLTVWVSNLMWRGDDEATITQHADRLRLAVADRTAPTVLITNEVGMGVHPETDLGRRYRDALGRVNALVASGVDRTLVMVAGRAIPAVDPWEVLDV
jgi:adenosyl cobinamide kinase/adenosyl cobinamide phosphate guanylyltransferase